MSWQSLKGVLDKSLNGLVIVLMAALVFVVCWQVLMRTLNSVAALRPYLDSVSGAWTQEAASFLLIWLGLLGACVGLREKSHIGVDYFTQKLSRERRLKVEALSFLLIALFSASTLIYGGATLALKTYSFHQTSPSLKVNMGWVYAVLPLSGLFLTIYSLELCALRLQGQGADDKPVDKPVESAEEVTS